MLKLQPNLSLQTEILSSAAEIAFHPSFYQVHKILVKWIMRFPKQEDPAIFQDLFLFYSLAEKKYLDHRHPLHLFRQVLAIYLVQKKILKSFAFSNSRCLEIRWIPTSLLFPFASKPVIGCLVGVNLLDRYELFDEENVLLILQKHLPHLSLVKDSSYSHISRNKNIKVFYFEIEKKDGSLFFFQDQAFVKKILEQKIKNSIQKLSPTIFIQRNEEEIYKNILILSQEIQSLDDLPQATIVLDQQAGDEISFLVTLVYASPSPFFSLEDRFRECLFTSERFLTIKYLEKHPVEAHIFHIHLPKEPALLRSDGSIDFYASRQKIAANMTAAIGEFRDYNGGILIKQQELLLCLKENFLEIARSDPELIETFFYALTPLEKQVFLPPKILSILFSLYLNSRNEKLIDSYSLKVLEKEGFTFLIVRGSNASLKEVLADFCLEGLKNFDIAFNRLESLDGVYFQSVLQASLDEAEPLVRKLKDVLIAWKLRMKSQKVLRIGFEYFLCSLDPRIGGETISNAVLGLLFEGLTRRDRNGGVENGIAEKIEISSDFTQYTFKLRPSFWNDRSPLTAYDFEYAWKKILSPDFATSFTYFFHMIKNAKEAKEGKVSPDRIGITVLDERTLKVELKHPCHYFLELTCHALYSPVHRLIDQQYPQWPYQIGKNYPCNGSFQLEINHQDQCYKLVKNPHYWDIESIGLDEIIFNKMNARQAFDVFNQGEIDWLGYPLGSWQPYFIPAKEDVILSYEHGQVCWQVFNTSQGYFHNLKLRQAIAYAIDRSAITIDAQLPLTPAHSPLLPQHSHSPTARSPQYNPEEARKLWRAGLQELGMDGKDFPHIDLIYHHKGVREHIALYLKHQLKETLGIECELKPLAWNVLFSKLTKGNFQMGIIQWQSWIDDPIYTLNAFRFGKADINFPKWEDIGYQELLKKSDEEINPIRRFAHMAQAEEILCQEMPVIPLFYLPYRALIKKHLNIFPTAPLKNFGFARGVMKKGDFNDC